jgi:putative PEP-CTERM system integral membrane protein
MNPLFPRGWPLIRRFAIALFWCWNVLFICTTLPMIPALPALVQGWLYEDVPLNYLVTFLAWMVVPWLCVLVAQTLLRARPNAVVFLFLGVEGPFFSLCLYRLIAIREINPAVAHWLVLAAFGLSVLAYDTVIRRLPHTAAWQALRLMAASGLALLALYVGAMLVIAWSPLALLTLWELVNPSKWMALIRVLLSAPYLLLFLPIVAAVGLLIAMSLLAMPLCMATLFLHSFVVAWRTGSLTWVQRLSAVLAMVGLQALIFVQLNHQPQREALAVLSAKQLSPAQFQEQQAPLREGLLNAYLGAYRYTSARGESNSLQAKYQDILGLPTTFAAPLQAVFNALAQPLLYDGDSLQADAELAAKLYEQYFDMPIQRGERSAIAKALSATYNADERESGLIQIDQRQVRVTEQGVRVKANADLASITLDETYENLTGRQQEIFYLFSLPETAVITGLWLGNDRDHLLPHVLATRGAAQRVYKSEVNRRVDPALLEQVGPRQYRLRAFPVPARAASQRPNAVADAAKLYLRLQYTVLAQQGAWPLPVLAEKRNVAWDKNTLRRCDGQPCPGDLNTWWPRELPQASPASPSAHAFKLAPNGPTVLAQPAPMEIPTVRGKRISLVVDRSWSMRGHEKELRTALEQARVMLAGNTVSVLLTTTPVMPQAPQRVALKDFHDNMLGDFMGGGTVDRLLQQAIASTPEPQDLTLVLTDGGAFDLDASKSRARLQGVMLSMVHLGGSLAAAYDDATLESMQRSGGSAFSSLADAWALFAQTQQATPGFLMQRNGYQFSLLQDRTAPVTEIDTAFAPLAAHLFINHATRQDKALNHAQLSGLHALAQTYDVVTPYSSMLVLVNEQQQEALRKAETQPDRFERAQESGTATLQKPNNPLTVSITPEPEEWLLLLVSLCVATWMLRQRYGGHIGISRNRLLGGIRAFASTAIDYTKAGSTASSAHMHGELRAV